MAEQHFPSPGELKASFEATQEEGNKTWQQDGMAALIESLSRAISDLREAGVNVHLQLRKGFFEDIWPVANKVNESTPSAKHSVFMCASGILKIDHDEYLLGISTQENTPQLPAPAPNQPAPPVQKLPVLKIYLSGQEFSAKTLRHDFRGTCYDLKEDPQAMKKFQDRIIGIAAYNQIIREHDICGVFENDGPRQLCKTLPPKPGRPSA